MLEAKVSPVVGRTQRQRDGKKKLKKRSQNPPLPPDKTIETARFFAALPSDASATAWGQKRLSSLTNKEASVGGDTLPYKRAASQPFQASPFRDSCANISLLLQNVLLLCPPYCEKFTY